MPDGAELYDRDFFAWTQDQARRLRALRSNALDVVHLAQEIEDMGKRDQRSVESLLDKLLLHCLKLAWHPRPRAASHWKREVRAFQRRLGRLFRDNPSLRARATEMAELAWLAAVSEFTKQLKEQGHPLPSPLPARLPYDVSSELLNDDWLPARDASARDPLD